MLKQRIINAMFVRIRAAIAAHQRLLLEAQSYASETPKHLAEAKRSRV